MASTNKQFEHILRIVDGFTKLQTMTDVFGNPRRIVTEKGNAFTKSELFLDFCDNENIEVVHTTTDVSRGNGQIERMEELIDDEVQSEYEKERDDLRQQAKSDIMKIQEENRRTYNFRRRPAYEYRVGDQVAIKRTQFGSGLKVSPKILGHTKSLLARAMTATMYE